MDFGDLQRWMINRLPVSKRLRAICVSYVLFLMIEARKHSQREAARFWGINKSQVCRFLQKRTDVAVHTLSRLSKRQAKQFSKAVLGLRGLPWKIAILADSTIQTRSTVHTDNAQRLNHGKGFVIGHQWTNVVLVIDDMIIPLPPIPLYTKKYCQEHGLEYKTENQLLVEYINQLSLEEYIGPHNPEEVLFLAESGYDDKKIQNAIMEKKWGFIIALNKTRSVKSERQYSNTPKSQAWSHVAELFRNHRRIKWRTVRIPTNGPRRRRIEFRTRQIVGYLRYVGKVQVICSEFKKRPNGRTKYLACNHLSVTARQILVGYRIRWSIETFHKTVKMHLGFEDVAAKNFKSVISHVHWVYCAYILLHSHAHNVPETIQSVPDIQRRIKEIIDTKDNARVLQLLTQFNGLQRYKNELRAAQQVR